MGKSAKIAKLRKDKYYQLAKEHGYRSRAAFKLIQLNRKFGFLNDASVVIDLCAAPGGWLQVVSNILPMSSIIIGVDLFPIKPIKNTITFVNDITTPECFSNIKAQLRDQPVDCVLHDGAPNVGQAWEVDAFGQAQLTLHSLRMAAKVLKPGGWFVTKIFRSRDYSKLIGVLKKLFQHVHSTKPLASRKESAEIFVVCQGYGGLKSFDSTLLEFKNVFREQDDATDSTKSLTLKSMFRQLKRSKPNRDGYNTDSQLLYSSLKLSEFLNLDSNIINVLSKINRIEFDVDTYSSADVTPDHIRHYCEDLQLLGYPEFKQLLDWRREVRAKFGLAEKHANQLLGDDEESNQKQPLTDEQIIEKEIQLAEMDQHHIEKRLKRKELLKNRLLKQHLKANEKMNAQNNIDIDNTGYFAQFVNKNSNDNLSLAVAVENDVDIDMGEDGDRMGLSGFGIVDSNPGSSASSGDEHPVDPDLSDDKRELTVLEHQLNAQMEFLKNAGLNKKKNKHIQLSNELSAANPKVVEMRPTSINDVDNLSDIEEDEDLDMEFLAESTQSHNQKQHPSKSKLVAEEIENDSTFDEVEDDKDLDEVEQESSVLSSSDDDQEDTKSYSPEMLALATRMKRSKKEKERIIDSLWNRHCKGDENLPQWFVDDETRATHRILPVTKEDVQQYKQMQKMMDAQPRKKVLEARQRKRTKIEKLIQKARAKTDKLSITEDDQGDAAVNQDKVDSVKRIYKKVAKELKRNKNKTYVVAKRHLVSGRRYTKPKSVSGPYKVVDARQKKDKQKANLSSSQKAGKTKRKRFVKRKRR